MVFCRRKKGTTDPKPRWEILDFLTRQVEIHLCDCQKVSSVLIYLSRRPEYFSTATSFGSCGSDGAFGGPVGAAGLFWDDEGERRGAAASLRASGG